MSIIKNIFGSPKADNPESRQEKDEERQFNLLRDNGVRAMAMNETKQALPCFEKALELRPDDRKTRVFMAEALLKLQEYEQALPLLQQVAAEEADNLDLHLLLAETQGHTARYADMRATTAALLTRHADNPRVHYLAAKASYGLHETFSAVAFLTQAITLRKDYVEALLFRAGILARMGQWHDVLADTLDIIKVGTTDEEALLLHADALAALGDVEEAEAVWREVIALNPFSREAYLLLAQTLEASGRVDLAMPVYNEAIEEMPDFAEAYKQRGALKLCLRDKEGAAEDMKRALELRPELGEEFTGRYTSFPNRMNDHYFGLNPYGL